MTDGPAKRRNTRPPRTTGGLHQPPWGQPSRPYAPTEVLSADHVAAIHYAALRVLAEIGLRVLHPPARALYALAGAQVAGDMVFFDPDLVMAHLKTVPPRFTLAARNPARTLRFGGNDVVFASVGGPAYVMDNDRG